MTDIENSNIMRKVKELGADIEKIEFQRIQSNDSTDLRLLIEPDFHLNFGLRQVELPDLVEWTCNQHDVQYRSVCECCYGGEQMRCAAKCGDGRKNVGQKDVPDMYFRIDDPKGQKIDRDVYSDCIVRKLAMKLAEAYRQEEI